MKKNSVAIFALVILVLTALTAFFNIRSQDNSADLIIESPSGKLHLDAQVLDAQAFEATLTDGRGVKTAHSYRGISMNELFESCGVSLEGISGVKVTSADNYSADFEIQEIENNEIYLVVWADGKSLENISSDGIGIQVIAPGDENSRRCVRYTHIIELLP